jgi:hypothetical protein
VDTSLSDDYAEAVRIGGQTLPALLGQAMLRVPGFGLVGEILIGFVRGWDFAHAGVLGQRGFLERVGVLFDRPNLRFGLIKIEASASSRSRNSTQHSLLHHPPNQSVRRAWNSLKGEAVGGSRCAERMDSAT